LESQLIKIFFEYMYVCIYMCVRMRARIRARTHTHTHTQFYFFILFARPILAFFFKIMFSHILDIFVQNNNDTVECF